MLGFAAAASYVSLRCHAAADITDFATDAAAATATLPFIRRHYATLL